MIKTTLGFILGNPMRTGIEACVIRFPDGSCHVLNTSKYKYAITGLLSKGHKVGGRLGPDTTCELVELVDILKDQIICRRCGLPKYGSSMEATCVECAKLWRQEQYRGRKEAHKAYRDSHYVSQKKYRGECIEDGCSRERGIKTPYCIPHAKNAWKRSHPEVRRVTNQRRRCVERGAEGSYTQAEWQELCNLYDNRCLACGLQKPLTVDHVVPLSLGGSNYISNVQPLCGDCNSRKGAQVIDYRIRIHEIV